MRHSLCLLCPISKPYKPYHGTGWQVLQRTLTQARRICVKWRTCWRREMKRGADMPNSGSSRGIDNETEELPVAGQIKNRPGPWPPRMEPLPHDTNHNPKVLMSWARRTGFKSNLSGETASTTSDTEINNVETGTSAAIPRPPPPPQVASARAPVDLEAGTAQTNGGIKEIESTRSPAAAENGNAAKSGPVVPPPPASVPAAKKRADPEAPKPVPSPRPEASKVHRDSEVDVMSQSQDADDAMLSRQSHMNYELRETPGLVPLILYGVQHYLSIAGSLVLIPLIIVPAMGGSDDDTARVISTVLLVSGVSTLLHSSFGSRLPLVQGGSFVYLAPALAIINSAEFQGLNDNRFKHIMKELQGAIIIASAFQMILGYTGLMSLLLRVINPVVVAPTVAAIGLGFFSYGFPQAGTCVEISIPQLLLVVLFALYLRKISIFGHRIFQVYAVPLGLGITWAYAFLLTEAGAYNYKGCDPNVPISNIISDACRKHVFTMNHCRTDASNAWKTTAWVQFPYPLQWGIPTFHWKTAIVMCAVSIIASVDSVGSYHATSLLVASRAPTPGVVSRGIGLEGVTSILAGLWGTGIGATTLTENVHTIAVTKMGSRRAVELGAGLLILISLVGKVGAIIASIPQAMVGALLCFMWAMLAALGLSNLRYSETGSSRNVIIVGLSLFLSLSVPAYFQQYGVAPNANSSVPSYFLPYIVASHGPFHSGNNGTTLFQAASRNGECMSGAEQKVGGMNLLL
eukprot:Gb_36091 [translate_table: standard]